MSPFPLHAGVSGRFLLEHKQLQSMVKEPRGPNCPSGIEFCVHSPGPGTCPELLRTQERTKAESAGPSRALRRRLDADGARFTFRRGIFCLSQPQSIVDGVR